MQTVAYNCGFKDRIYYPQYGMTGNVWNELIKELFSVSALKYRVKICDMNQRKVKK